MVRGVHEFAVTAVQGAAVGFVTFFSPKEGACRETGFR